MIGIEGSKSLVPGVMMLVVSLVRGIGLGMAMTRGWLDWMMAGMIGERMMGEGEGEWWEGGRKRGGGRRGGRVGWRRKGGGVRGREVRGCGWRRGGRGVKGRRGTGGGVKARGVTALGGMMGAGGGMDIRGTIGVTGRTPGETPTFLCWIFIAFISGGFTGDNPIGLIPDGITGGTGPTLPSAPWPTIPPGIA